MSVFGNGPRMTALVLATAAALALALRWWAFAARGIVDFDETYYYILGTNLLSERGYTLNGLPHTAFPPLYPILVGLASLLTSNMRIATSDISW